MNTSKGKSRARKRQIPRPKKVVGLPRLNSEQAKVLVAEADEILQRNSAVEAERLAWLERTRKEDEDNARRLIQRHRNTHARDEALRRAEFHCEELVKQVEMLLSISRDLKVGPEEIKRHLSELIGSKFKPFALGGRFGRMQIARTWRGPKDAWVAGVDEAQEKLDAETKSTANQRLGPNAEAVCSNADSESDLGRGPGESGTLEANPV